MLLFYYEPFITYDDVIFLRCDVRRISMMLRHIPMAYIAETQIIFEPLANANQKITAFRIFPNK